MRHFSEQELVRREKLASLVSKGVDPFGNRFDVNSDSKQIFELYDKYTKEELHDMDIPVVIAGRIMTKRVKGKAGFMHIQDKYGQIQVYVREDVVGELEYSIFDEADLGDIVGIAGHVFRTNMGELSVKATKYTHLVKSLRPLPEKWHGLSDVEERFRRRYVDLITNEDARKVAFARPKIIRSMQKYLDNLGYVEVETPVLSSILGGAAARPFM
jgi:lysyl-tRNA synthetase, class II